jgi:predicted Zn-dependent protease
MGYYRHRPYDRQLEGELTALENKAETVRVPGADAPFYNAAGDLCAEVKDDGRAMEYYGRAVDAYLNAERWEAAAAMCRKIVRAQPGSVRARCTLSWLAIGKGFVADAQTQITDYAEAAYMFGRESLATNQLRRMGEVAVAAPLRVTLAEQLLTLGAERAADQLFGAIYREQNFGRRGPNEVNWSLVRQAALLRPDEIDANAAPAKSAVA